MFLLYFLLWYYSVCMSSKFPTTTKTTLKHTKYSTKHDEWHGKGGLVGGQTMNATVRYLNPIWLTVFPVTISKLSLCSPIYICVCYNKSLTTALRKSMDSGLDTYYAYFACSFHFRILLTENHMRYLGGCSHY